MSTTGEDNLIITGSALRNLASNPAWCPHMKRLDLYRYNTLGSRLRRDLQVLSATRMSLTIETMDDDRYQSSKWLGGTETVESSDEYKDEDVWFTAHVARRRADSGSEPDDETERILADYAGREHSPVTDDDSETDLEELRYKFMRAEIMERFTTFGAQEAALIALENGGDMTEFGFEDASDW